MPAPIAAAAAVAGKKILVNLGITFLKKVVPVVLMVWAYLGFMFVNYLVTGAEEANAASEGLGSCSSNGLYKQSSGGGVNQTVADIAYKTALARGVSDRVMLALFETGLVESGFRNLANDGVRGSEDYGSSDADLAKAKESMQLTHDGVGSDHTSVGFLQQQNGWGSVAKRMDPAGATGLYLDVAVKYEKRPGSAGRLAQAVQVSAFPTAYDGREADARALIEKTKKGNPAGPVLGPAIPASVTTTSLIPGAPGDKADATADVSCSEGFANFVPGEKKVYTSKGVKYEVTFPADDLEAGKAMAAALSVLGTPYRQSNTDNYLKDDHPEWLDCSSLMLFSVYRGTNGRVQLPRIAADQQDRVKDVTGEPKRPGDMIFWGNPAYHVAMYLGEIDGKKMMVSAPRTGDVVKISQVYGSPANWGRPNYIGTKA